MTEAERVLSPLAPRLLYLVHRDAGRYLREQAIERKGADTISRIVAYTETTAWAREREVAGMDAFVEFYRHYRHVCDELVERSSMEPRVEDTSNADWSTLHAHLHAWLDESWA